MAVKAEIGVMRGVGEGANEGAKPSATSRGARRGFALSIGVAAVSLATSISAPARAQSVEAETAERGEGSWPASAGARLVGMELGLRSGFVKDAGFDPYSENDVLNQGSLGVSATFFRRDALSIALGARWDWGASSANARGAATKLWTHRLSLPVEVRWQLDPPLYVFARVAAGALYEGATLDDPSAPGTLSSGGWVPSADASLGAAVLIGPYRAAPHTPRWWLVTDLGYGYASARDVRLSPDAAGQDPRRYGVSELPRLALRGGFLRFAVAATF